MMVSAKLGSATVSPVYYKLGSELFVFVFCVLHRQNDMQYGPQIAKRV